MNVAAVYKDGTRFRVRLPCRYTGSKLTPAEALAILKDNQAPEGRVKLYVESADGFVRDLGWADIRRMARWQHHTTGDWPSPRTASPPAAGGWTSTPCAGRSTFQAKAR